MGDPDDVIVDMAEQLKVGLLVIGNAGRSGLAAAINNNTVERVLDKLDCDLLAVS
jgi:universal stress protein E